MALAPGSRLGSYEITAKLGEGGMGEVYRATDTKLDRRVAIKVLPAEFTEDKERLARFEREAKLLAQLHHPNIASIFGLEESDGTKALVMELVEGPTLAERLEQGPLPFNESLSVSLQIAHALEEAHEKGIVHRDLKPQNIKASLEGKVKVLDFGLAKAMDPAGAASGAPSASQLAASPTLTLGATVQGMILGTAAYMAPEQARGVAVDRRADVWAFGVVLYEMLTGESPFLADTVPDTLARVLTREVDLEKIPETVPPAIRRLVRRCLVRQPKDRLHAIADARIVIEDVLAGRTDEPAPAATTAAPPGAQRTPGMRLVLRALPWLGGAALGVALATWTGGRGGSWSGAPAAMSASVRTLVASGVSLMPSVSPDGRTLAFQSERDGTEPRVWIKDLASGSERLLVERISGGPVFSPDGRSVLFMAGEGEIPDLFRISLATREERLVARQAMEGDWAPDGRGVVFLRNIGDGPRGGRDLVAAELEGGGERVVYTDREQRMGEPRWSPDGRWIAVLLGAFQAGVSDSLGLVDAASGRLVEHRLDSPGRSGTKLRGLTWVSPRRLALLLIDASELVTSSGRIALFDADSGALSSLLPLANIGWGLDVAGPGALIVGVGSEDQNLHEATRIAGNRWSEPTLATEGPFRDRQPVYSPDGRWLLFTSNRSGNLDVWRKERATGELQKLTDHDADDWDPALSPDGGKLLFSSNRTGRFQVWLAEADGSSPRQVTDLENAQNPTMTADGAWIVFVLQDAGESRNGVWKIRPDGTEASLVAAGAYLYPEASPDGRYAAFGNSEPRKIVRLANSALLDAELDQTARYRWSVEGGRTFLWTIGLSVEGNEIRRYPFDPERGALGPAEIVVASGAVRGAETLGVARDGSALTFARFANPRGQLIRIDGLEGLQQ